MKIHSIITFVYKLFLSATVLFQENFRVKRFYLKKKFKTVYQNINLKI